MTRRLSEPGASDQGGLRGSLNVNQCFWLLDMTFRTVDINIYVENRNNAVDEEKKHRQPLEDTPIEIPVRSGREANNFFMRNCNLSSGSNRFMN